MLHKLSQILLMFIGLRVDFLEALNMLIHLLIVTYGQLLRLVKTNCVSRCIELVHISS